MDESINVSGTLRHNLLYAHNHCIPVIDYYKLLEAVGQESAVASERASFEAKLYELLVELQLPYSRVSDALHPQVRDEAIACLSARGYDIEIIQFLSGVKLIASSAMGPLDFQVYSVYRQAALIRIKRLLPNLPDRMSELVATMLAGVVRNHYSRFIISGQPRLLLVLHLIAYNRFSDNTDRKRRSKLVSKLWGEIVGAEDVKLRYNRYLLKNQLSDAVNQFLTVDKKALAALTEIIWPRYRQVTNNKIRKRRPSQFES